MKPSKDPLLNLNSGTLCAIISDSEGVIHMFDSHYVWFHIGNVRNSLSMSDLNLGQKLWFMDSILWVSLRGVSSWSVATNVWTKKESACSVNCDIIGLHNCGDSSHLATTLRAAKVAMRRNLSKAAELFVKALNIVKASQACSGNAASSSKLSNSIENEDACSKEANIEGSCAPPPCSKSASLPVLSYDHIISTNLNVNQGGKINSDNATAQGHVSHELKPPTTSSAIQDRKVLNGFSTKNIKELSPTEGVLVINNAIIWMHSSNFSGSPKDTNPHAIHYTAALVWGPATIDYKFRLYEAQSVWFSRNKRPKEARTHVTLESCVQEDVYSAFTSKNDPTASQCNSDQYFKVLCDSLIGLKQSWSFIDGFLKNPIQQSSVNSEKSTNSSLPNDDLPVVRTADIPVDQYNIFDEDETIPDSDNDFDVETNFSDSSLESDYDKEEIRKEEIDLVATILSKLIIKKLRSDWDRRDQPAKAFEKENSQQEKITSSSPFSDVPISLSVQIIPAESIKCSAAIVQEDMKTDIQSKIPTDYATPDSSLQRETVNVELPLCDIPLNSDFEANIGMFYDRSAEEIQYFPTRNDGAPPMQPGTTGKISNLKGKKCIIC